MRTWRATKRTGTAWWGEDEPGWGRADEGKRLLSRTRTDPTGVSRKKRLLKTSTTTAEVSDRRKSSSIRKTNLSFQVGLAWPSASTRVDSLLRGFTHATAYVCMDCVTGCRSCADIMFSSSRWSVDDDIASLADVRGCNMAAADAPPCLWLESVEGEGGWGWPKALRVTICDLIRRIGMD